MRDGFFRIRIFNKQHTSFNLLDLVPTCILKQNVGEPCLGDRQESLGGSHTTIAVARLACPATPCSHSPGAPPRQPHNVPSSPSETTSRRSPSTCRLPTIDNHSSKEPIIKMNNQTSTIHSSQHPRPWPAGTTLPIVPLSHISPTHERTNP